MLTINMIDKWSERDAKCDICGNVKSVKYHTWDSRTGRENELCNRCVVHAYAENSKRENENQAK